jgi:hypothetical protein
LFADFRLRLTQDLNMRLEVLGMAGALPCGGVSVVPWFLRLPVRGPWMEIENPIAVASLEGYF